jgi:hypothetical protein
MFQDVVPIAFVPSGFVYTPMIVVLPAPTPVANPLAASIEATAESLEVHFG